MIAKAIKDRLIPINEAAQALGVSPFTIRRLMEAGSLRSVYVGKRRLIPQTEVEKVLAHGCQRRAAEQGANK